jgi:hypothetical protein
MEAKWNREVAALATVFSCHVAQMTILFQNYLEDSRQLGSAIDLCANYPRCLSIASR